MICSYLHQHNSPPKHSDGPSLVCIFHLKTQYDNFFTTKKHIYRIQRKESLIEETYRLNNGENEAVYIDCTFYNILHHETRNLQPKLLQSKLGFPRFSLCLILASNPLEHHQGPSQQQRNNSTVAL